MPAIVLQTELGEMVGYLLIAGDRPLLNGPPLRDAIMTGIAKEPTTLGHPLSVLVQENKNVEFQLAVTSDTDGMRLTGRVSDAADIVVEMGSNGMGNWHAQTRNTALKGRCRSAA